MDRAEIVATGDLAAEGFGGLTTRVEELHAAIADRAFAGAGPAAAPARLAHDAISAGIYGVVRAAGAASGRAAGRVIAMRAPEDAPAFADTSRGAMLVGTLNGFLGDRLAQRDDRLSVAMTVRAQGRKVTLDRQGLATAYPAASSRVAVFLHGLCESEAAWQLGTRREAGPPAPTYGERLQAELGLTPVLVRYNTGLRISANGRELDDLLDTLVANWPVPADAIVLIGHSMGALVARSACHGASAADRDWPARVSHTVSLGAPHLGAPLERGVNLASRALRRLPEGRPVSSFLDLRSVGIRDLRHGSLVEDDWRDHESDDHRDNCTDVPHLEGARHYAISASLSSEPHHLRGRLLGDLLVHHSSATGAGKKRRVAFGEDDVRHVGGLNHFQLLNDPLVYEQLRDWLST